MQIHLSARVDTEAHQYLCFPSVTPTPSSSHRQCTEKPMQSPSQRTIAYFAKLRHTNTGTTLVRARYLLCRGEKVFVGDDHRDSALERKQNLLSCCLGDQGSENRVQVAHASRHDLGVAGVSRLRRWRASYH